jgi:hypothetical protein
MKSIDTLLTIPRIRGLHGNCLEITTLPKVTQHESNKRVYLYVFFTFCWPCIVLWLLDDQRDTQFFIMYLFLYLTLYMFWASTSCSTSGETNCVNTTSGNCHSVSVAVSCAGRNIHFRPAHDTATDTEWQLPEIVLTQFVSPDDEHYVLETCRELNIKINTW